MRLRFATSRTTRIRFFSSASALEKELTAKVDYALVDLGAPVNVSSSLQRRNLPAGEACKQWEELGDSLAWLSEENAERSALLAGVGGGAALDLAGLTASLYRRGMPLVLVPTTLLGMVDATLGGKTAVDDSSTGMLRKNFAGSFYPADEVWVYPGYLGSLSRKERLSGAGECWKTLWIAGKKTGHETLLQFVGGRAPDAGLAKIIKKCLQEKLRVVESDPLDTLRKREILNYGHTVGHALESMAEGRLAHGECVLWGMWLESAFLGLAGMKQTELVEKTVRALDLQWPEEITPRTNWEKYLKADKKSKGGKLEMTVLKAPGKSQKIRCSVNELADFLRRFVRD